MFEIQDRVNQLRLLESRAMHHAYGLRFGHEVSNSDDAQAHSASLLALNSQGYDVVKPLAGQNLRDQGIHIFIAYSTTDPSLPIQIMCRGTSAEDASLIADFDAKGPGYSSMVFNRKEIIVGIEEALEKSVSKDLEVSGHSLGGALSQLILWLISIERIHAPKSSAIREKLSSVLLATFHSAHINEKVHDMLNDNLKKINDDNNDAFPVGMISHQHYLDPANISGSHALAGIDPKYANVEVVRSSMHLFDYFRAFFNLRVMPHNASFYSQTSSPIAFDPVNFKATKADAAAVERIKSYKNYESVEDAEKVKNYLGARRLNLTRVFGLFYPYLYTVSTPLLRFFISIMGFLARVATVAVSVLWTLALPSVASILLTANSCRELIGYTLDEVDSQIFSPFRRDRVSVSLVSHDPAKVNECAVERDLDVKMV